MDIFNKIIRRMSRNGDLDDDFGEGEVLDDMRKEDAGDNDMSGGSCRTLSLPTDFGRLI